MPNQRLSAAEPLVKGPNESILYGFDFTPWLASGVTLSSVSSVAFLPTSGAPSAGSLAVNAATFVNGKGGTVQIGKGAQCRITGGTVDTDYDVTCTVVTSAGDTLTGVGVLMVRDE